MEIKNNKKRDRAVNFSHSETNCLVDLVMKFNNTIENKKTDTVTNKEKELAWEEITTKFNATSGVSSRNPKTLKLKYESLKKATKKKAALNRQNLYKTGGGEPEQIPYTPIEDKILSICSNIGGMEAIDDSDKVPEPVFEIFELQEELPCEINNGQSEPLELTPNEIVQENKKEATDSTRAHEETNWKQWNPTALKKKISPYLKKSPKFPSTSNVKEKFEELGNARLELVQLQIEAAKLDLKNKKAEHDLHMSQKQEEHDVKLRHLFNDDNRKEEEHMLTMEKIRNQK